MSLCGRSSHFYLFNYSFLSTGSISFIATNTRPGIAMAVSYLSAFGKSHGEAHWQALLHLLAYLYHSRDLKLTYRHQPEESANIMSVYTDSGYDSCDPGCLWTVRRPHLHSWRRCCLLEGHSR